MRINLGFVVPLVYGAFLFSMIGLAVASLVGCGRGSQEAKPAEPQALQQRFDNANFWEGKSQAPAGYNVVMICRHTDSKIGIATYVAALNPVDKAPDSMADEYLGTRSVWYVDATILVTQYRLDNGARLFSEELAGIYRRFSYAGDHGKGKEDEIDISVAFKSSQFFRYLPALTLKKQGETPGIFVSASGIFHTGIPQSASVECRPASN